MVVVGRIQGPYGIKGWVHIASFTDPKENIQTYAPWQLGKDADGPGWRSADVESIRPHKQGYVAKLSGIEDRNDAEAAKGLLIGVAEANLPEPDEDEFYWRDLIGAAVVNVDGQSLGKVAGLIETGAHDVLVIQPGEPDAEETLIPFHADYVLEVEMAARLIRVDWQAAETD